MRRLRRQPPASTGAVQRPITIAVVADYDPATPPHQATDAALALARASCFPALAHEWSATGGVSPASLAAFDGAWAGPRSPYASPEGMSAAIRYARESGRPLVAP